MALFFDTIIFGFLICGLAILMAASKYGPRFWNRRANTLLMTLTALAMGTVIFGSFVEPRLLTITHQAIALNEAPTRVLSAAVVSDIHAGPYQGKRDIENLVTTIAESHPDVIFLLGDFVEQNSSQAEALSPFATITDVYPTYAILGNHDYQLGGDADLVNETNAAEIQATLERLGIRVLKNEGIVLEDTALFIAGVDELWSHHSDLQAALLSRPASLPPTILLSHNPDVVMHVSPSQGISLLLAGHTHGGQIRLPFIGPVPPIPDKLGRAYDEGLFDYLGTKLFITSGVGESGPRARLFNPPEIALLTIEY